jgi:hypothetical protein
MGTWSPDILGSDGAMDTIIDIEGLIGVNDLYPLDFNPSETRKVRSRLEASETKIIAGKVLRGKTVPWSTEEWLVIAAAYLATGATIPDQVRDHALNACREEIADLTTVNSVGWSFPVERIKVLERHVEDIQAHKPGQITEIAHVGLFEAMRAG